MKSFDEALSFLLAKATVTPHTESVVCAQARGRVLANPVISSVNVPPYDNSQMDGYAIDVMDLTHEKVFDVSQRIPAGSLPTPLKIGTVSRIFTGAPIPESANAVIMQEQTETLGDKVKIDDKTARPGQNIRRKREDIAIGDEILAKGHRLRAQDLGYISSIGIKEVEVYRPLKIAIFSTGDELLEPGQTPEPAKIFNSNRYLLSGAIPQLGFELIDMGRVEDDFDATLSALKKAEKQADVVMTTGGVSVGEEDHVKSAVEALGSLTLWQVKMKPGKPLAFGKVGETPFIGLPGNPVSAFSAFYLFARPFLLKMQGMANFCLQPYWLAADFNWTKPSFRREFVRVKRVNDSDTKQTRLALFSHQGSGVLTSTVWADGFAVIPEDTVVNQGDLVAFYPFNDMI